MAKNNPAQDTYNPPGLNSVDFEKFNFGELEVNELFWLSTDPSGMKNVSHRKVSQTEGMHLKNREVITFNKNLNVFQKT